MDPLTRLLDHPRAQNVFTLRVVMRDPWCLDLRDGSALTIIVLTNGSAWLTSVTGSRQLLPGDVAVVRGPAPYRLGTQPDTEPIAVIHPGQVCRSPAGVNLELTMNHGINTWGNDPDGPHSMIVATYESAGEIGRLVAEALPEVAYLAAGDVDTALVDLVADRVTVGGIAQSSLLDRLMDALLISSVRAWLSAHPECTPGWINGSRDPVVGTALSAIHENPEHPWTIAGLADRSHVSRATLAARFRQQVGVPPLTYLTRWRLTLASDMLADPRLTLASIARSVGYSSPFAFSAAFKKQFGASPARYRQQRHQDRPAPPD
ncbi:AraC family transcriptional regulator [Nakamurella silvestris]|nr:AraC family transcriptional regulator [Nakamurella silvestris]